MKKKIIALFLVVTLGLVGCGSTTIESSNSSTEDTSDAVTDALTTDDTASTDMDSSDLAGVLLDDIADVEVQDVQITIDDADWDAILADPTAEEYYSADITIGDETVTNVGFRTKGASSLSSVASSDSDRYSFKINVDKYVDDQTILGTNKFVLNSNFSDPSYMREYLTYTILKEMGCDVPEVKYSNVYINGELFGFYLYAESYDDTYMDEFADSDDANLYKAEADNCTLNASDGTSGFELQEGDDEELANLDQLIETLSNTDADNTDELEAILDVDSVLKAMAVNYICGNYDSYSGIKAHNYYLLYTDGQFTYLPWDCNMAFGGFTEDGGASISIGIEDHFLSASGEDRPLFETMLENEEYEAKYESYCTEVATMLSNTEGILSALEEKIGTYVQNDPSAFYTYEEFQANLEDTDVDLSTIQSKGMSGKGMDNQGQLPGQGDELGEDAQVPTGELPTGQAEAGQAPTGQAPTGQATAGQAPPMLNEDGTTVEAGDATNQIIAQGGPGVGGQAGGQVNVSSDTVSLYDYIEASIARVLQ